MTTIYEGIRDDRGTHVTRIVDGGRHQPLPLRLDLDNHSPTGFEWGYGGSGPAQLALALLADALGDDGRALRLHQQFKWRVIAPLSQDEGWQLTRETILRNVAAIEQEEGNDDRRKGARDTA